MRAVLVTVLAVVLLGCVSVTPPATAVPPASGALATASPFVPPTVALPTVPPLTIPPITLPPITLPPVTLPPVTLPPVTLPPVTQPPVTAPPVTAPPATDEPGTPDPNATPAPTRLDVLPFLTSEVVVVNLTDTIVAVSVAIIDAETDEEFGLGVFEVQPEQVTVQAVAPTRIRLLFEWNGAPDADERTCTIDIGDESVEFAVVSTGIVITAGEQEPADAAEMVVATSTRCHAGDAT